MRCHEWVEQNEERFVSWRREFHRVPEVGWTEFVTTAKIVEKLEGKGFLLHIGEDAIAADERLGVPDQEELDEAMLRAKEYGVPTALLDKMKNGTTGVVARLDTGRAGAHTVLRFDIDGLPITEATDDNHLPFKESFQSTIAGNMHACGHDGHTAIGLAVAHYISHHQDELTGTFTLLFQPAEEGSRGAKTMAAKGWLTGADYFLSGHIGIQDGEIGQIAATTTGFLATTKFDLAFTGKAAHAGAYPETGKNAMIAASAFVQNALAIPRHSDGTTRINIGTLTSGSGRNVIPDRAALQGETRGQTDKLDTYMFDEVQRVAKAAALMSDVEANIEVVGHGMTARCDDVWVNRLTAATAANPFVNTIIPTLPIGASEDAAVLMTDVQNAGGEATYMIFGTPLAAGHHHPSFDYDERVLSTGVATYIDLICSLHE
ncbi:amidohydrolase [Geomicrobium sp. JSM 1781026]|uniref:amidohydrolase n=1 Tax=Geomicrobium sp. JSM 1781026 TaxID=3344580 RepID=UPI0035C107FC